MAILLSNNVSDRDWIDHTGQEGPLTAKLTLGNQLWVEVVREFKVGGVFHAKTLQVKLMLNDFEMEQMCEFALLWKRKKHIQTKIEAMRKAKETV